MKIKPEHYEKMESVMRKLMADHPDITLEYYTSNGCSEKRFRWDCWWACIQNGLIERDFVLKELYDYCNDTHIDTALRRITNTK